jgi:hypothetical protein
MGTARGLTRVVASVRGDMRSHAAAEEGDKRSVEEAEVGGGGGRREHNGTHTYVISIIECKQWIATMIEKALDGIHVSLSCGDHESRASLLRECTCTHAQS